MHLVLKQKLLGNVYLNQKNLCFLVSRIFVFLWITIIIFSIYINSLLPIFLFLIPKFFTSLNAVWGLTQHMGLKEDTKDHRESTRSVRLNPIFSFIYWKMEYHIEHHMFPTIPSYNLPNCTNILKISFQSHKHFMKHIKTQGLQ